MTRPRTLPLPAAIMAALLATVLLAAPVLAAEPAIVVQPGDTLSEISLNHGVSVDSLVALNALSDPNRIYIGQRLRLVAATPAAPDAPTAPVAPAAQTHVVQRGEHLTGIARTYGTSVSAIAAANGIANPSLIHAGQRLTIPGAAAAAPAAAPATRTHVVQRGEHLTGIARTYGTTIAVIVAANGIADPSRIFAGRSLVVPGAAAATAPAAATPTAPAPALALPSSLASAMAARDGVRRVIVEEADRFGVPVNFALAVAWQESGWQQGAVSWAGAIGVMQLLPSTADWIGSTMLGAPVNPYELRSNVRAGVILLGHYLDRYGGDRRLALAAYYQGQAATDTYGIYAMTRAYIGSILSVQQMLGG